MEKNMCLLFSLGFWKKCVCVCVRGGQTTWCPLHLCGDRSPRPPTVDAHGRRSLRRTPLDIFVPSWPHPKNWPKGRMSLKLSTFCTELLYPNSTKYCNIVICRDSAWYMANKRAEGASSPMGAQQPKFPRKATDCGKDDECFAKFLEGKERLK